MPSTPPVVMMTACRVHQRCDMPALPLLAEDFSKPSVCLSAWQKEQATPTSGMTAAGLQTAQYMHAAAGSAISFLGMHVMLPEACHCHNQDRA